MGAPAEGDIVTNPGTDSDSSGITTGGVAAAYGGAIKTAVALNGTEVGALIKVKPITGSDQRFCGSCYFKNTAASTGKVANAKVYNRTTSQLNTSAGRAQLVSNSALDTGQVLIIGKVSGIWTPEYVTLTGTTPVLSINTFDASSIYRWESLNISGLPTTTFGNVTCSVAGETNAVLRGSIGGKAILMATAEFQIVLAALDTTVGGANYTTLANSFVAGDYARASSWDGDDRARAVASNELDNGHYVGVGIFQDVPASIPAPVLTYVQHYLILKGNPQ